MNKKLAIYQLEYPNIIIEMLIKKY